MLLGNRLIVQELYDFYIIAEIGTNFYDFFHSKEKKTYKEQAKAMITSAFHCGADAVKFQVINPEKLTTNQEDLEFFEKHSILEYDDYLDLMEYADWVGIEFIATLFDEEAVKELGPYLKIFKIASPDITYEQLIRKVSAFHKPILLSTGGANKLEIKRAINWIEDENSNICLMHCVSAYPTKQNEANLGFIKKLKDFYGYDVGYSDHTMFDLKILNTAFLLGGTIIEKHFTFDIMLKGNDHIHSMNPNDLKDLKRSFNNLKTIMGNNNFMKRTIESEEEVKKFGRRSIVANRDIKPREKITEDMLAYLRPGTGIAPYQVSTVLEKQTLTKIEKGSIIDYNYLTEW